MDNITGKIILADDAGVIEFDNNNTASGSWAFKRSVGGGGFKLGGCSIGSCSFTLFDKGSEWSQYNLWKGDIEVKINGRVYFTGIITSASQSYNTIQINASDLLYKADQYCMSGTMGIGFTSGTRADLVQAICNKIGLAGYSGLAYGDSTIVSIDATVTCRQALSYVAEASGQYCYVDSDNILKFGWYGSEYTPLSIFGRNLSRNATRISGVRVIAYDDASKFKADTEVMSAYDTNVNIANNPCITSNSVDTDFDRLNPVLKGKTFTTGSLTVQSDPNMKVGTFVKVPKYMNGRVVTGEYVMLPCANVTYKPYGTSSVSCNEIENQEADLRETQSERMLDNAISNQSSKLAKAIKNGGGGGGGFDYQVYKLTLKNSDFTAQIDDHMYGYNFAGGNWWDKEDITMHIYSIEAYALLDKSRSYNNQELRIPAMMRVWFTYDGTDMHLCETIMYQMIQVTIVASGDDYIVDNVKLSSLAIPHGLLNNHRVLYFFDYNKVLSTQSLTIPSDKLKWTKSKLSLPSAVWTSGSGIE